MSSVFIPDAERLESKGVQKSALTAPVIFDSNGRYARAHNAYLRDKASLAWQGNPTQLRILPRGSYPSANTLLTYAHSLKDWIDWCGAKTLNWQDAHYENHVLAYDADMASGAWSQDRRPLKPTTRNLRTDTVVDFLNWAAHKGMRPVLTMPRVLTSRRVATAHTNQPTTTTQSQRAGRARRPHPDILIMPTPEQIRVWLHGIKVARGTTKELMCRMILRTGMRREEVCMLSADFFVQPPERWRKIGDQVRLPLERGTKGGRARTISVSLEFALELHQYATRRRLTALTKYRRAYPGADIPDNLFLSEYDGKPIAAQVLYEAWTLAPPMPGWSPHGGRHWWACQKLLERSKEILIPGHDSGWTTIKTEIQPQLGHLSEETTLRYLRWAQQTAGNPQLRLDWSALLEDEQ